MIVKGYIGDGHCELWQALGSVQFLNHNCGIAVTEEPGYDYDFWDDERFPTGDVGMMMVHPSGQPVCDDDGIEDCCTRFYGWAKWYDAGSSTTLMLVTDGPIYICNDQGDTIEAIRANAYAMPKSFGEPKVA